MSNSTQNETHNVCNERLAKEGGNARCCDCEPHEGCTLGDRIPEASKTIQNDWEKRFIKEFVNTHNNTWRPLRGLWVEDVLDFIRNELADARKEVEKEILEVIK